MRPEPFAVVEPPDGDSPVLVEVPHAGLAMDAESLSWLAAPAHFVARDADLYVDELLSSSPEFGATLLCANLSRYVVDLNRSPDDFDGGTVTGGPGVDRPRGVVWRLTSSGMPALRKRLTAEEWQRRRSWVYQPYHDTLAAILERKRQRFGFALLLCGHSMPSPRRLTRSRSGLAITSPEICSLADLVPGTRGRTTAAAEWIDLVERVAEEHGLSVEHDTPYRGGFSTAHYGHPDHASHAVQIEIARHLYMDEETFKRKPEGFEKVQRFCNDLVGQRCTERPTTTPHSTPHVGPPSSPPASG
jgi:N-formylglutamate amidohydrolase